MTWLRDYLSFRSRKKAKKALEAAERQRNTILRQIAHKTEQHKARSYLRGNLMKATEDSLRASVAGGV